MLNGTNFSICAFFLLLGAVSACESRADTDKRPTTSVFENLMAPDGIAKIRLPDDHPGVFVFGSRNYSAGLRVILRLSSGSGSGPPSSLFLTLDGPEAQHNLGAEFQLPLEDVSALLRGGELDAAAHSLASLTVVEHEKEVLRKVRGFKILAERDGLWRLELRVDCQGDSFGNVDARNCGKDIAGTYLGQVDFECEEEAGDGQVSVSRTFDTARCEALQHGLSISQSGHAPPLEIRN
jgi:hypothetical protein